MVEDRVTEVIVTEVAAVVKLEAARSPIIGLLAGQHLTSLSERPVACGQ